MRKKRGWTAKHRHRTTGKMKTKDKRRILKCMA